MEETLQKKFFDYVEEQTPLYIERLAEAVAIPSVSAQLDEHLPDVVRMIEWTKGHIERLGGSTKVLSNPVGTDKRPLPPILLGEFHVDPSLMTVCVYGHLDVQPADKEDGWDTEPFELTQIKQKLFGRGSTDDKGPALSWLWIVEAHQKLGIPLPINIKILFEGMEEYGSDGLFETIVDEAKDGKFLNDVDFFCISDNYWLGKEKPCITYGLRGLAYFEMSVQCCEQDLHSGVLGGAVHEGMTDLVKLMSTLVDTKGKILVEGVMDSVKPVTPEETALYDTIDFDVDEFKKEQRVHTFENDKTPLLMGRWRYPTLSLHGIEGAFSGKGAKTVIPAKVIGKFSMRLVPDQDPKEIEKLVVAHVEKEFAKLGSPNKLEIAMVHGAKSWLSETDHPNYQAAAKAIEKVHGVSPDFTREGGSIPITSALEDATGVNVLLLPIGASDDMAHSQNEKYNITNMVKGIKVLGLYLHELGTIKGPKPSSCRCAPLSEEELMVPGAFLKGFKCKCEI
mmetsp:Transcript_99085/g.285900  ORF Transcript_99085/g.285900 Transcript_99085/m.285900 type:complete len:508 (-) Transcript_99085:1622-3145(-)|eukprot:CAMPEP_0176007680 /NCGR_PEP_ID=MMETSP0120_2-20121206/3356_1 /TAXON_ID=160619 /ORGANISM="Kryptoperidinium foliaceum, Strain CCMP 1326" /LENGTH=507 /DNA_ID=CAMNT_0017340445 /DNA_START=181 /DNA_END=1704 /DNA_ORIENTATION=-